MKTAGLCNSQRVPAGEAHKVHTQPRWYLGERLVAIAAAAAPDLLSLLLRCCTAPDLPPLRCICWSVTAALHLLSVRHCSAARPWACHFELVSLELEKRTHTQRQVSAVITIPPGLTNTRALHGVKRLNQGTRVPPQQCRPRSAWPQSCAALSCCLGASWV